MFAEPLPGEETARRDVDFMAFLVSAIVVVMGVTPVAGTFLKWTSPGTPYPYLVVLAVGTLLYATLVIWTRRFEVGAFAALLVTMTMAADVPLGTETHQLGSMGPRIWLFQLPLAASVLAYLAASRHRPTSLSSSHLLFVVFIAWAALAGVIASPSEVSMVGYFVVYLVQAFLVFHLASQLVAGGVLRYRTVLGGIALTVVGHAVVGVFQFVGQSIYGMSTLGASGARNGEIVVLETLSLGPLGEWGIGPFVSGFTGGEALAYLAAVCLPIIIGLAATSDHPWRWLAAIPLLAIVIRVSAWDTDRGAALVGLAAFAALAFIATRRESRRGSLPEVSVVLASVAALLYPASRSGSTAKESVSGGSTSGDAAATTADGVVTDLSIPFFDLSHLGFRLRQWVVSLDLWTSAPLTGIGGGTFWFAYADYTGEPAMHHNMYFNILVETGAIGALLYAALVGSVLLTCLAVYRAGDATDWLLVGVVAGFTAYFAGAMFNVQFTRAPALYTFWAIAGVVVGHYHHLTRRNR